MKGIKNVVKYFSAFEWGLWLLSITLISVFFFVFDRSGYLSFAASLVGATSLIFCAKGNPVGQVLMIAFSVMYGIISYSFAYYGEMLTYLSMTGPMAVFALISWLRNPYNGNRSEVKVNRIKGREVMLMLLLSAAVTVVFYFVLTSFGTANIIPSTFSVTTSFIAVYLTFRRSPYFALAYSLNDLVLIVLWSMAAFEDLSYLSVLACFVVFLVNDLYGFVSWRKMQKRQES